MLRRVHVTATTTGGRLMIDGCADTSVLALDGSMKEVYRTDGHVTLVGFQENLTMKKVPIGAQSLPLTCQVVPSSSRSMRHP